MCSGEYIRAKMHANDTPKLACRCTHMFQGIQSLDVSVFASCTVANTLQATSLAQSGFLLNLGQARVLIRIRLLFPVVRCVVGCAHRIILFSRGPMIVSVAHTAGTMHRLCGSECPHNL